MVWKGGAGEEEETDGGQVECVEDEEERDEVESVDGGQVEGVEVLEELHEVESVEEEEED